MSESFYSDKGVVEDYFKLMTSDMDDYDMDLCREIRNDFLSFYYKAGYADEDYLTCEEEEMLEYQKSCKTEVELSRLPIALIKSINVNQDSSIEDFIETNSGRDYENFSYSCFRKNAKELKTLLRVYLRFFLTDSQLNLILKMVSKLSSIQYKNLFKDYSKLTPSSEIKLQEFKDWNRELIWENENYKKHASILTLEELAVQKGIFEMVEGGKYKISSVNRDSVDNKHWRRKLIDCIKEYNSKNPDHPINFLTKEYARMILVNRNGKPYTDRSFATIWGKFSI